MKAKTTTRKQGFALAAAMAYIAIMTVLVTSVASLILNEYRFAASSEARLQALYAAEAGIELALREFNREARGSGAWTGWTRDGVVRRLGTAPDILRNESTLSPEMRVAADTTALTITTRGRAFASKLSPAASRTVVVTTRRQGGTYVISSWRTE